MGENEALAQRLKMIYDRSYKLRQLSTFKTHPYPHLSYFYDPSRIEAHPCEIIRSLPKSSAFVFRHFGQAELIKDAKRIKEACLSAQVSFIIGKDSDLYHQIGADGVHFPFGDLAHAVTFQNNNQGPLVSISAHDHQEIAAIEGAPLRADAVFISPIFQSQSPSAKHKAPLGAEGVRQMAAQTSLPLFAMGGIDCSNIDDVINTGVCGVAGTSFE